MKQKLLLALLALFTLGGSNLFAQNWTPQAPTDGDFYLYNVGTGTYLSCGSEYWGTKACIDNGALNFTLASNGEGAYTLYTTKTFSYGDPNTAQLQSSGYVDQSVTATTWTFTAVEGLENTYTMLNAAGTYLVAPSDGTKSILLNAEVPTTNYGYWKLINKDNLFPETASESNPVDITCLIGDASFESTNDKMENFWTIIANNNNLILDNDKGLKPNNVVESWQSSNGFTLSQTITVPNGYYKLTAQTWCREYTVTGADLPYIYLNEVQKPFNLMGTETASLGIVAGFFSRGDNGNYYTTETDVATVSAKSITLGAKGTRTNTWNVFDNFKLYYLGPIDLSTFVAELANAVAAAQATEGTIPTAAYNAIAAVVEENNKTYEDGDAYSAAITAINNAVSTYASAEIVAAYANYNNVKAAVLAVDNSIDVTEADALANDGTDANLDDALAAVRTALKNYLKTSDKTNVNLTDALLINPSFETGDFTGWTNNNMSLQTNTSFGKDGNVYCEKWQPNGTFSVSQTLTAMPAGVYQLTAKAKARGVTSAKLSAGGIEKAITIADSEADYTVEFAIDDNTDVTFKYEGVGTGAGSSWLVVDNFRLTLAGAGLPDVTAITGKMNAQVAAAQTTAIETYNANKTVANYNAAQAAIAAAQASVDAYAKMPQAITDATALKDAHNFVTAAATTTFAEAIAAAQNGYDNGTLTDAEANNYGNLGVRAVVWHNPREEANRTAAEAYMKSVDFGMNYNDWSVEGESDGSNFVVPFFEYWVSDANNLAAATKTATLTDLPNGLYSVQAWVRVRAKNETSATDATGITMDVNGGTAVDVTEGEQVGTSQFQLATYEAEGLVKDGNLTVNFNIAANNNISWLSFQNVKYEKVRDLTPEEQAVVPTGITLDETTTVFKGKTLQLTPVFAPENATQFVTWASDNETVATVSAEGVVTAVAYGTANITVTSTLNAEATATCAVTVTAPLITEAQNLDFAEGPVISNHIRTYAKDIQGSDVSGLQEVTGWTIPTNGDARAAGVMTYGSNYGVSSNDSKYFAPGTGYDENSNGKALGIVAVWDAVAQYTQSIRLEAGLYTIKIPVYNQDGTGGIQKNLIGFVEDEGAEHFASTTNYPVDQWTDETISFELTQETYGFLSVGYDGKNIGNSNAPHLWIDRIVVEKVEKATPADYTALNEAIEAAEAKTLGFDAEEYSPYNNVAALKALAAAKAIDQEATNNKEFVTDATTTLNSATWTPNTEEVNAVHNGMFATVQDGANYPEGWNRTNAWGQMQSNIAGDYATAYYNQPGSLKYGENGVYTMPLKENTAYVLNFAYRSHENNSNNGVTVSVLHGEDGLSNKVLEGNGSTTEWKTATIYFTTGAAGNYVLTLANSGNTWMTNVSIFKAKSVDITIKEGFTATTYSNENALDFSNTEGMTACIITDANGTEVEVSSVPAGTGVYVKGAPGTYKAYILGTSNTDVSENKLVGTGNTATQLTSNETTTYYVFGRQGTPNKEAFYKVKTDKATTVSANKAYLKIDVPASEAKDVITVGGSETDGINAVETVEPLNSDIYNLQGQKVNRATRGIYIVNGKKVVIK